MAAGHQAPTISLQRTRQMAAFTSAPKTPTRLVGYAASCGPVLSQRVGIVEAVALEVYNAPLRHGQLSGLAKCDGVPAREGRSIAMKRYTFRVFCTFEVQHTFGENEVQPDSDGDATDVEPTDDALQALGREFESYLAERYAVSAVEVSTDSDLMLGTLDESE